MKILFITQDGYALPTARVRGYFFSDKLKELGFDTQVFSLCDHLSAPAFDDPSFTDFQKLKMAIRLFKVLWKEETTTVFYLQKVDYHCLAVLLVSLLRGFKFILDVDDWEESRNALSWLKVKKLTEILASRADSCVVSSRFLVDYLSKYSKKVIFIPTVVDENKFMPKQYSRGEKIVFSWAGIVTGKEIYDNLRFVIEAFAAAFENRENVVLEIVGGGPLMEHTKKYVQENFSEFKNIRFVGFIEPDKMNAYYETVDVGIIPLIQKSNFNLAKSPTKMFEYMAKGIAVIASNLGEASLIISHGENGFLFSNKEECVVCMLKLATDDDLRKNIGNNARKLIEEKYCLSAIAEQLAKVVSVT